MSFALIKAKYLQQIADVLRARNAEGGGTSTDEQGVTRTFFVLSNMATAVRSITGSPPSDYTPPANTHGEMYCIANKDELIELADAIRAKLGVTTKYRMNQMASAILSIDTVGPDTPSTDYTDYDFEVQASDICDGTAANLYVNNGVKLSWSSASGTNLIRLFPVILGRNYLVFYGVKDRNDNAEGDFVIGTFPTDDVPSLSGVQSAQDWSWAGSSTYYTGLVLYTSITGTLAARYSTVVANMSLHVIDLYKLLNSSRKNEVILQRSAVTINGSSIAFEYNQDTGAITKDGFYYGANGNNIIEYYRLQKNHSYYIYFQTPADYFSYILTEFTLEGRTTNSIDNYISLDDTGGAPYNHILYGDTLNKIEGNYFLAIQVSKTANTNYTLYVLDVSAFI